MHETLYYISCVNSILRCNTKRYFDFILTNHFVNSCSRLQLYFCFYYFGFVRRSFCSRYSPSLCNVHRLLQFGITNNIHGFTFHIRAAAPPYFRFKNDWNQKWNSGQFDCKLHKIEIECNHILNANWIFRAPRILWIYENWLNSS